MLAADMAETGGRAEAFLIGHGHTRVQAALAARVLGTAGHAHDWDDTHLERPATRLRPADASFGAAADGGAHHVAAPPDKAAPLVTTPRSACRAISPEVALRCRGAFWSPSMATDGPTVRRWRKPPEAACCL